MLLAFSAEGRQSQPADSLWKDSLRVALNDIQAGAPQAEYLLSLAEQLQGSHPGRAVYCAEKALSISRNYGASLTEGKSLYWCALLELRKNTYGDALDVPKGRAKLAAELFRKQEEPGWLARSYDLAANIHFNLEEDDSAVIYTRRALAAMNAMETAGTKKERVAAEVYYTAGKIAGEAGSDSALVWINRSQELHERTGNPEGVARAELLKGFYAEPESREGHFLHAIELYRKRDNRQGLYAALIEYAVYCINQYEDSGKRGEGWYRKSTRSLREALQLEQDGRCEARRQLGIAHHWKAYFNQEDNNTFESHLDSAYRYYESALIEAEKESNFDCIREISEEIAKTCKEFGGCPEDIVWITQTFSTVLQERKAEIRKAGRELTTYQVREEQMRSRRRLQNLGLIAVILLLGFLGTFYLLYQRQRIRHLGQKLKAEQETSAAKQKALENQEKALRAQRAASRAQLNPHFILNTLNAIDNLVNFGKPEDASYYLTQFTHVCWRAMENSRLEAISLADEVETLQSLLALEQLRLPDILNYKIEVEEGLDQEKISMPPMLLQPFVENAIWHGIQKKQAPGKVSVQICSNGADWLKCVVEDNGIGREKAAQLQRASVFKRPSRGSTIINERIQAIEGAELNIIDLKDNGGQPRGTRIEILLPKKTL